MNTQETLEQSFISDIPLTLARAAYSGTSFTPERRADSTRREYAQIMDQTYADLSQLADKNGTQALLASEFSRFREGYLKRYKAYLSSNARCISWMITGPANFPTARNEKRNNIAHKRLNEMVEFRERALKAIRRTLCPSLRPIMSGDSDAVERLTAEIAEAETQQERMKLVNTAHKRFLKDPASLDACDLPDKWKEKIRNYKSQYSWEPHPFAPFELTNNGANIRRMRARLEQLTKAKATRGFEAHGEKARLEDCPAENRVRLFYPGKPDEATRSRLKSAGFRWSPTIGCWQAYRHQHTYEIAQRESGVTDDMIRNVVASDVVTEILQEREVA